MSTADFTLARAKRGEDQIFADVTVTIDGVAYPWSGVAVSNPSTYENGFREARIILIEDLKTSLSDRRGPLQAASCTIDFSDMPDPVTGQTLFRKWLGDGKKVRNAEIRVTLISDAQRRLGYTPKTVFRGIVKRYSGPIGDGFRGRFDCLGILGTALNKVVIDRAIGLHFPSIAPELAQLPLPIALGRLTDELSATAAPTLATESARGVTTTQTGYGDLTGNPATGFSLVENLGAGSLPAGRYRAQVFAYHSGNPANPADFLAATAEITISGGSAVTASWSAASGGATFYRVALAVVHSFAGEDIEYWHQYKDTSSLSFQFTDDYAWDEQHPDVSMITPGAEINLGGGIFYERWSAVMADGETALSDEILTVVPGFMAVRPRRSVIVPVVGAASYNVYRRTTVGGFTKRLSVPTSNLNGDSNIYADYTEASAWALAPAPISKGKIKPIIIGPLMDIEGFLWPCVAVYSAIACDTSEPVDVFLVENDGDPGQVVTPSDPGRYGVDITAPGQTGWATYWGAHDYWEDLQGYRWMFVAIRGPDADRVLDGSLSLRINALGADDVGDCTGTVVEKATEQLALLIDNLEPFATSTLATGNRATSIPTFSDATPKRDAASFTLAETNAAAMMPEGLECARWLTDTITWSQLIADLLRSSKLLAGINLEGQIQLVFPNPTQTPAATISFIDEILKASFGFSDTDEGFATVVPYEYCPDYSTPGFGDTLAKNGSERDTTAEDEYDEKVGAEDVLRLPWCIRAVQAKAVAQLTLQESRDLPRFVPMDSGIHWTMLQLGDLIAVTHPEGPLDGGYADQVLQIVGMRVSVDMMKVSLTCIELRIVGTDGFGNPAEDEELPVIAFSGYGDTPITFLNGDGTPATPPAAAPVQASDPCEGLARLSSGRIASTNGTSSTFPTTGIGIFNVDWTVFAELAYPLTGPSYVESPVADDLGFFYGIGQTFTGGAWHSWIQKFDESGNVATYDLGAKGGNGFMNLGVSRDGTVAYYAEAVGGVRPDTVKAWDLSGNASLGTFVTKTGFRLLPGIPILTMPNGDVIIAWEAAAPGANGEIVRYNSAGVPQATTYAMSGADTAPVGMSRDPSDTRFWVSYYDSTLATYSGVQVVCYEVATGTILQQFVPEDGTFEFDGPFTVVPA